MGSYSLLRAAAEQVYEHSNALILRHSHFLHFAALCLLLTVLLPGCGGNSTGSSLPFDLSQATYVGRDSCIKCHAEQADKFVGSHHDKAMQLASDDTVLGDFNDATVEHHNIKSRMFRRDGKFFVNTEGPDGEMTDFEVKYVFGLEPLQQYMVEFPADGSERSAANDVPRVQVLRLCWDTEKENWFYLAPPDVEEKLAPDDDLHWTGVAQRWNNMCADCHSTDFRKEFIPPKDHINFVSNTNGDGKPNKTFGGEYHSTFFEIDVSCESCHGPASVHVELANQTWPGWSRERGYGLANLKEAAENQIQACAPCHSRRNIVQGGFKAGNNFYDHFSNQLLTENVYYPDGQILDEDYVHGSFIQSKMYHKGIKCSDCHDPHSAKLKHNGNEVCTSCHQHPAAKYDSVGHHFHKAGSEGAKCVNCHMPATTYMAIDSRRDHSFRIPRPDLSTELGTPNACTGCHLEKENISPEKRDNLELYQDWMLAAREGDREIQAELERANQWCDEACDKWYGENRRRDEHFGIAIAAGQSNAPDAVEKLERVLGRRGYESPAIARATALQVLSQIHPEKAAEWGARAIEDDHPLVRTAATSALAAGSNFTKNSSLLRAALSDPIRSVRTEAVRNLLSFPMDMQNTGVSADFRNALDELRAGLNFNNDRAGAHLALGIMAEQQGRNQQAMKHYGQAIGVEPNVTGPRTNLAALLERSLAQNGNTPARESISKQIDKLRKTELPLLERDASLLPNEANIQYRLGLALYVDEQTEKAATHLERAAELEPDQPNYLQAAAMLFEKLANESAEKWSADNGSETADPSKFTTLTQSLEYWSKAEKWIDQAAKISPDPGTMQLNQQIHAAADEARARAKNQSQPTTSS
ncbi:MAG: cytochrome c3 family protein [Aureliella sp.]